MKSCEKAICGFSLMLSSTRSRALLLLPLVAGIGMFLGPLLGGFLSSTKPTTGFLSAYPFALPNIVIACCYAVSGLGVLFFLQETLETHDASSRPFWALWIKLRNFVLRRSTREEYSYVPVMLEESPIASPIPSRPSTASEASPQNTIPSKPLSSESPPVTLSFREIWTSRVIATLCKIYHPPSIQSADIPCSRTIHN